MASLPRFLCVKHKAGCQLENGELLSAVMKRAEPRRQPLEGGGLALIYNPVFITGFNGSRLKGWTDFTAGGLAVIEDRFHARNYFEFQAHECDGSYELLQAIHIHAKSSHVTEISPDDLLDFFAATVAAPSVAKLEGTLRRLWDFWCKQQYLERIRMDMRRRWPDSYDELNTWFHRMRTVSAGRHYMSDASAGKFVIDLQRISRLRQWNE